MRDMVSFFYLKKIATPLKSCLHSDPLAEAHRVKETKLESGQSKYSPTYSAELAPTFPNICKHLAPGVWSDDTCGLPGVRKWLQRLDNSNRTVPLTFCPYPGCLCLDEAIGFCSTAHSKFVLLLTPQETMDLAEIGRRAMALFKNINTGRCSGQRLQLQHLGVEFWQLQMDYQSWIMMLTQGPENLLARAQAAGWELGKKRSLKNHHQYILDRADRLAKGMLTYITLLSDSYTVFLNQCCRWFGYW